MNNLTRRIKSLFCPSVDGTLKTFQKKVKKLNKRIDFDVDEINAADKAISQLNKRKAVLELNISKAEKAAEKLAEIIA